MYRRAPPVGARYYVDIGRAAKRVKAAAQRRTSAGPPGLTPKSLPLGFQNKTCDI